MHRSRGEVHGLLAADDDVAIDLGIRKHRLNGLAGSLIASGSSATETTTTTAAAGTITTAGRDSETASAGDGLAVGVGNEIAGEDDGLIQVSVGAGDTEEITLWRGRIGFERPCGGTDGPVPGCGK